MEGAKNHIVALSSLKRLSNSTLFVFVFGENCDLVMTRVATIAFSSIVLVSSTHLDDTILA